MLLTTPLSALPLGAYIHWPYCARICPYCDFNVHKKRQVDAARWADAFARDLRHWAEQTGARKLRSLYFGGGTPSLAPLSVIERIIETCASLWGLEQGAEITLEANPTDAELSRFGDFRRAGVNRLSLGVQSFDDAALKFLKRNHDAKAAHAALDLAFDVFPRVTFDLIYALPGQSTADWRRALRDAVDLGASHLSLYQLTIEEGTPFARAASRGLFEAPADDLAADLFDATQEETVRAGLPAYEISNHARPGEESRHNLLYWTGGDYIGVGPGAHGRLTLGAGRVATEAEHAPEAWLSVVEEKGSGATSIEELDPHAQLVEKLAMGLRLAEGIALGPGERESLNRDGALDRLVEGGLVIDDPERLGLTAAGRPVLNAALAELFAR